MSIIAGTAIESALGGYQIERSLRFNSADSAYLNRTPSSAGNLKTWTWSAWVKRSYIADSTDDVTLFGATRTSDNFILNISIKNNADGSGLQLFQNSPNIYLRSAAAFRDPSAWYHIVVAVDTTQSTNTNRVKMYVNGVQITSFNSPTYPAQNDDTYVNNTYVHDIGVRNYLGSRALYMGGYMTEMHHVDGQALDPTSFGEYNVDTGVWQPIAYSGSYGTNGFYLNFSDNSGTTSTTLGKDYSGNGNNWTPNNFSVTAGAGNDSMVDVPTRWGTDTGVGGEVRGNYCTLNPLKSFLGSGSNRAATLSNGNLQADAASGTIRSAIGTWNLVSGKWYWEATITAGVTAGTLDLAIGIRSDPNNYNQGGDRAGTYVSDGQIFNFAAASQTSGASFATGDTLGFAVDADAGTIQFYKNGSAQGSTPSFSYTAGTQVSPYFGTDNTASAKTIIYNFGQRPFAYAAPSGFKALCTTNLPDPAIAGGGDYFSPVLYTGTGATQSITGVGFAPDLVWLKSRSDAYDHYLFDTVRGATKALFSNATSAEDTTQTNALTAFNSDGFSLGDRVGPNGSGSTYVAWNWKANGAGVSNTAGTITSTVSANTTSGFSIITHSGTGSNGTIGHGLGVAPQFVLTKRRSAAEAWTGWHVGLSGGTYNIELNNTNAQQNSPTHYTAVPTSTVINLGTNTASNASGSTYVTYAFAPVSGYSAFGSYTGNGSADGPFIFCNFRPRYVLWKGSSFASNWRIADSARNTYNVASANLEANLADAEGSTSNTVDFLSNGFKIRGTGGDLNTSGGTIVYAAFAENPFKYALAR